MDLYVIVQDFYRKYLGNVMEEVTGYLKQTQPYEVLIGNNGCYILCNPSSSEVPGISSGVSDILDWLVFYKKSKSSNGKGHGREYKNRNGEKKDGGNDKRRNGKGPFRRGKKPKNK